MDPSRASEVNLTERFNSGREEDQKILSLIASLSGASFVPGQQPPAVDTMVLSAERDRGGRFTQVSLRFSIRGEPQSVDIPGETIGALADQDRQTLRELFPRPAASTPTAPAQPDVPSLEGATIGETREPSTLPLAPALIHRIESLEDRAQSITSAMGDPEIQRDRVQVIALSAEHGRISKTLEIYRRYVEVFADLEATRELLRDAETEADQTFLTEQIDENTARLEDLDHLLKGQLLSKDPLFSRNAYVEIRIREDGASAQEVLDNVLYGYLRFLESQNYRVTIGTGKIDSMTEVGRRESYRNLGSKDICLYVEGENAFGLLRRDAGTHQYEDISRRTRKPRTGRLSIAVFPERELKELIIKPNDIRTETFRSGGPGGQSVNTTDSAVRITHLPSGTVVEIQDERSQHQNLEKARRELALRLSIRQRREREAQVRDERRDQVGDGISGGWVRNFDFIDGKVVDRRLPGQKFPLSEFIRGRHLPIVHALIDHEIEEELSK